MPSLLDGVPLFGQRFHIQATLFAYAAPHCKVAVLVQSFRRQMRLRLTCVTLAVLAGPTSAQLSPPPTQEFRVVYSRVIEPPIFASDAPTHSNIFTVDTGLPIENQITEDNKSFSPVPSPDGSKIAFIRLDPETCEGCLIAARYNLAVMNVDGSELHVVQPLSSNFPWFKWSPDGKFLLFFRWFPLADATRKNSGEIHLFLISVDSSTEPIDIGPTEAFSESWSPDGKWIAFGRPLVGKRNLNESKLCVVSSAAPKDVTVVDGTWNRAAYSWSPDGSALAYFKNDGHSHSLVVARPFGNGTQSLASVHQVLSRPVWSPEGTRLLFADQEHGKTALYKIALDGSAPLRITDPKLQARDPLWSPDGERIAFLSYSHDRSKVYVAHADGSDPRPVGLNKSVKNDLCSPRSWLPDSQRLIVGCNSQIQTPFIFDPPRDRAPTLFLTYPFDSSLPPVQLTKAGSGFVSFASVVPIAAAIR